MDAVARKFIALREQAFLAHPANGGTNTDYRRAVAVLDSFRFWQFGWPEEGTKPRCLCGCGIVLKFHPKGRGRRTFANNTCGSRYRRYQQRQRKIA